MLRRRISLLLAVALSVCSLPGGGWGNRASAKPQRVQPVIDPVDDGNQNTDQISGRYPVGGQFVGIDAYSVESDTYYAPTSDGGWEERVDYYYADSDQIKSDGTNLAYAAYELDRPSDYSILHITLGGVTLTYNLETQEAYPVSDQDRAALEAWLAGADGSLARSASASVIDQGYQPTEDVWTGHVAIAMLLAPDEEDQSAAKSRDQGGAALASAMRGFKSKLGMPAGASFFRPCSLTASPAPTVANNSLSPLTPAGMSLRGAPARQSGCFGCCGPGCHCINDRNGRPIYSSACSAHDSCIRSFGYVLGSVACGYLLTAAIVVVLARTQPRILILSR
jgi:hypothetical protein